MRGKIYDIECVQTMYKSYSIRSDLDKFLKSKNTTHDRLIKALFGRSNQANTHVLTWLSENPEGIGLFKSWLKNNGGKPILDRIHDIASESAHSKEHTEDHTLYRAWSNMVAEDGICSKKWNDWRKTMNEMLQSHDKEIKSLKNKLDEERKSHATSDHDNKCQIQQLTQKVSALEQQLKSVYDDKSKLEEELREERIEKSIMANKIREQEQEIQSANDVNAKLEKVLIEERNRIRELEKKLKTVKDDHAMLEEELRAYKEHNMISEKDIPLKEENNAQEMCVKTLGEVLNAFKAEIWKLAAYVKEMNDYMLSSDDAKNYSCQY